VLQNTIGAGISVQNTTQFRRKEIMNVKKTIAVWALLLGAMLFADNTAEARWGARYYRPYIGGARYVTPHYWTRPNRWYSNRFYHVTRHGNHYHWH
jgi:hypothetical protein